MKFKNRLFTGNVGKLGTNYWDNPFGNMKTWLRLKDKLEIFLAADRFYSGVTKAKKKYKARSINRRSLLPMFYTYTVTILGYSLRKPKRTRILTMRKNIIPDNLHVFKYRKDGAK